MIPPTKGLVRPNPNSKWTIQRGDLETNISLY